MDAAIRIWSLQDQSCLAILTAHYSAVTSLTFSADGHTMLRSVAFHPGFGRNWVIELVGSARLRIENKVAVSPSSGRDKICIVWDLRSHQALRTVPVFEVGITRDQG